MTENKRYTAKRIKNQVSKKMENYIQYNGTTILKLSSFEDCKDVVDLLNEQDKTIKELQLRNKQYSMMVNVNSDLNDEIYEQLKKTEKNYKSVLEENEQLKSEINMLKTTIGRNESYIARLTHKSEWHN
jgi:DNA repair exonuclease SbcCD ATPase subunit